MKCPACNHELTEVKVADINVDICKGGCGGIWFDNFEFKKFDEPHESAGCALLNIEKNEKIKVDPKKRRNCPRCTGSVIMMRHFESVKKRIEVDECPKCGGLWLDSGELAVIRDLYNTESEKSKAAEACLTEVFGGELERMKNESEAKLKSARKIANALRFLCPSYYIKGKQDWGAF